MFMFTTTLLASTFVEIYSWNSHECSSHAKEGIPYTLQANFKFFSDLPLELLWTRNNYGKSKCTLEDGCVDYWEDETNTTMQVLEDGTCQSNLTIKNVTEKECGMWLLHFLGPAVMEHSESLYTCSLKIEDNSQHINNKVEHTSEVKQIVLLVLCISSGIMTLCTVLYILLKSADVPKILKNALSYVHGCPAAKTPKSVECGYVEVKEIQILKV